MGTHVRPDASDRPHEVGAVACAPLAPPTVVQKNGDVHQLSRGACVGLDSQSEA